MISFFFNNSKFMFLMNNYVKFDVILLYIYNSIVCAVNNLKSNLSLFLFLKQKETSTNEASNEASGMSMADQEEHFVFGIAEAIFVGWFTFEYIIRYIAAPQKCR